MNYTMKNLKSIIENFKFECYGKVIFKNKFF